MASICIFCGDALDPDAVFGRRNFCRYNRPDCNTEYNNMMRSLTKAEDHPSESIRKLARLLTEREISPLKPIKDDWMKLTRKKQPANDLVTTFENRLQIIYAKQLS